MQFYYEKNYDWVFEMLKMYDVNYQYFNSISKHEMDNILDHGMTTQMGFE